MYGPLIIQADGLLSCKMDMVQCLYMCSSFQWVKYRYWIVLATPGTRASDMTARGWFEEELFSGGLELSWL